MATSSLNSSFLVLGRGCGRVKRVYTYGFLILGGQYPIVVDTGYRDNAIMESLGMRGLQFHENMIENQLARHGVKMGDVRFVCHTHLHIDHAGKDDHFPMNTTVVLNRREMECSVSGLMHPQYPKPDIMHLVERLHTPGALRFEDLELSGPIELMPGVVLEAANAHTDGSMNVHVETAEGRATICGDVIYDFQDQIIEPYHIILRERSAGYRQPYRLEARREGGDQEAAQFVEIPAAGPRQAGQGRTRTDRRTSRHGGAGTGHPNRASSQLVPGLSVDPREFEHGT